MDSSTLLAVAAAQAKPQTPAPGGQASPDVLKAKSDFDTLQESKLARARPAPK